MKWTLISLDLEISWGLGLQLGRLNGALPITSLSLIRVSSLTARSSRVQYSRNVIILGSSSCSQPEIVGFGWSFFSG